MSAAAKLAAFAAALVAVFAVAIAAGGAIGPDRDGSESQAASDGGHSDGGHAATKEDEMNSSQTTDEVPGLAVADNGLKLALDDTALAPGAPSDLRFRIVDAEGTPVRDFALQHDKRMHLIVVRRDGRGFQHLHPELGEDGTWSTELTLSDPGAYRVFADYKRGEEAQTLAADVFVDGRADYAPLPAPEAIADTGDGYEVALEAGDVKAGHDADLRFAITKNGRTIETEPYLGAGGHLVALREGDLADLHVHPEEHDEGVAFAAEFPSDGRYRLYLQFKHEGRVHTAEFTQDVQR